MINLNTTEAVEQLAEVMPNGLPHRDCCYYAIYDKRAGFHYCNKCGYIKEWNPLLPENLHQAFEVLEVWLKAEEDRDYTISSRVGGNLVVLEALDDTSDSLHESLNYAVCEAILSAVHGEQVRIKE